jgi:transketolase
VLRPADATETVEAWKAALYRRGPSVLVLTRQKLPIVDRSTAGPAAGVRRGGYVLIEPQGGPEAILIASGSEVSVAMEAASRLLQEGVRARVVSLPSWELFEEQPAEYRRQVLPPSVRARVSIEAAATFGWLKYVTEDGESIGIDHFGASAPGDRLFKEFGITAERAVEAVHRVLSRSKA